MTEREWREAIDMRPFGLWLAAAVVGGVWLRVWHLGHGLPFVVGETEAESIGRAVRMMQSGDLNPHFFGYPAFHVYLQLAVACVRFLMGAAEGLWRSLDQVQAQDFVLWGRVVSVCFGAATIAAVHQVGLRWGARHALLAASLIAVMPLHVRDSRSAAPDVALTFLITLTMLLALRAHERGGRRPLVWAGIAAGLAAATQYVGGIAILLPVIVAARGDPGEDSKCARVLTVLGAGCGAFLCSAPFTVLDLPGFLNGVAALLNPAVEPAARGTLAHYVDQLRLSLRWPALLLAIGGVVLGVIRIFRGAGVTGWTLVIVFPLVYLLVLSQVGADASTSLLPIVPFACILAANGVISGVTLLRRFSIPRAPRTALIIALTLAALAPPLREAIIYGRMIGRTSTQEMAYDWVMNNAPPGSRIAVEGHLLRLPEDRYTVEYFSPHAKMSDAESIDRADYLITSSKGAGGFSGSPKGAPHDHNLDSSDGARTSYRAILEKAELSATLTPSERNPGPELKIFRLR